MPIKKLFIHHDVRRHPLAISIKNKLNVPVEIHEDPEKIFSHLTKRGDSIREGKEILSLAANKGAFIKKCPGTKSYLCCGYHILHIGTFCTMDCSYCVLQSYFHPPFTRFFVNIEDLYQELDGLFQEKKVYRIGTGEFTDSLLWEKWINLSKRLVPKFANQNYCILELKSKTVRTQNLEHLDHNRKTIVSWSLNTTKVIQEEEQGTASLSARLEAASQCQAWGYPLAFHFDPLIIYDNCHRDYMEVVDRLFANVHAENIAWISMGTFRFMPALKKIIQNRFPESKIVYGEFINGLDDKMRYFKPMRIRLYRKLIDRIRAHAPNVLIYFCMEDEAVWRKCLGFIPEEKGGLANMLDLAAARLCGLKRISK